MALKSLSERGIKSRTSLQVQETRTSRSVVPCGAVLRDTRVLLPRYRTTVFPSCQIASRRLVAKDGVLRLSMAFAWAVLCPSFSAHVFFLSWTQPTAGDAPAKVTPRWGPQPTQVDLCSAARFTFVLFKGNSSARGLRNDGNLSRSRAPINGSSNVSLNSAGKAMRHPQRSIRLIPWRCGGVGIRRNRKANRFVQSHEAQVLWRLL